MKTYSDIMRCPHCKRNFTWKYIDDGHRFWMKRPHLTITSHIEDKSIALCTRKIDELTGVMYFNARCTHCREVVSFPCNEDMLKELTS